MNDVLFEVFHIVPSEFLLLHLHKLVDAGLVEGKAILPAVLFLSHQLSLLIQVGSRRWLTMEVAADHPYQLFIRNGGDFDDSWANLAHLSIDIKIGGLC